MRIALFSPRLDVTDGYGNITYEYCHALAQKKGMEFTLFLPPSEKKLVEQLQFPYPVRYDLARYVIAFNVLTMLPYLKPVRLKGFDIVHSLFDFPHCFQAAWSARLQGLPFIMGVQGTYGVVPLLQHPDAWFLRYAYRRARAVTVPSAFTKDLIQQTASEQYPTHIIHNGVNIERFSRKVDTATLRNRHPQKQIILTVGGLKFRKGQDLVIRALTILKNQGRSDILYIMVGDGPQRAEYEALAQSEGVADSVVFAGSQSGDDLLAYYDSADIYVHTPRVFHLNFEGFGIVYLEASARRKPIVATDAGGIRDAVLDEKTGIVVPDGDVPAIARAIGRLLDSASLRTSMGEAGRAYAEHHDWSVIVDQFLPLYRQAAG